MSFGGNAGLGGFQSELEKEIAAQKKIEEQQNRELQRKAVQSFKRRGVSATPGALPFSLMDTLG